MRLSLLTLFAVFSITFGSSCGAQTNSLTKAKSVLTRFLALNNQRKLQTLAAKNLLIGEARRFSKENNMRQFSALNAFKLVDSRHAVGRVQALDGKTPVTDLYFYLTLSTSTWKISSVRALALTGMIEGAMRELQAEPKLTTQERQALTNIKLTLSLDRDLQTYFKSHRKQFEQLRALATQNPAAADAYAQKMGLSYVSSEDTANLQMVIGGMADNSVGYLYSASNQPPKITDSEYIWVEKIADKWYLFRTT